MAIITPTISIDVTLDVWSFDCETQHCTVMLGDKEIGQIAITGADGFLSREDPHGGSNMMPKGIPAKIDIPYILDVPERNLDAD